MTEEEIIILKFLRESPETWYTRREIARKAVKRRVFDENQHWADAPLGSLVSQRSIEESDSGLFRFGKSDAR